MFPVTLSSSFFPTLNRPTLTGSRGGTAIVGPGRSQRIPTSAAASSSPPAISYHKFVDFAIEEAERRNRLIPSSLQESFGSIIAADAETELKFLSFQASKIRHLRSMCIDGNEGLQVLDFAAFPEFEYDFPIFCANFFSSSNVNIIVLDLNPLHNVITNREYKEKYYKKLIPLGLKYADLLPWGGKLTSESIKFFSPIVIWTRFSSSQEKHDVLFAAFQEYFKAWLELIDQATRETNDSLVISNREAQHRYLTWRAEKDPGHRMLKNLVGENRAKEVLRSFLFNGVDELGSKTFLEYFPEYGLQDGSVNEKRSMVGKSFKNRPWDPSGEFIGDGFI